MVWPHKFCKSLAGTLNPWQSALHILECTKLPAAACPWELWIYVLVGAGVSAYCCNSSPNIGIWFPKHQASIFHWQFLHCVRDTKDTISKWKIGQILFDMTRCKTTATCTHFFKFPIPSPNQQNSVHGRLELWCVYWGWKYKIEPSPRFPPFLPSDVLLTK